jgi:hypothetical protein
MNRFRFHLLALALAGTALAQDVPPPRPADEGPSLEVTMKFIGDKLNEEGPVGWNYKWPDDAASERWSFEVSGAVADTKSCTLTFRQSAHRAALYPDFATNEYRASFRDIKKLTVLPLSLSPAKASNADLPETAVATMEVDLTQRSDTRGNAPRKKVKHGRSVETVVQVVDPRTIFLYFNNEEMAHRVAKAITHVVELCGGGEKPEPF